ncbi:coenzyme F420-0:L-glutamate ligase [Devosia sp. 2618]|uniref:coenzyme F420-0:L-glutamate ligase n=1 Tax=Devosia sp. 2618 TaxID=3156454 RepID=UPI00339B69CA
MSGVEMLLLHERSNSEQEPEGGIVQLRSPSRPEARVREDGLPRPARPVADLALTALHNLPDFSPGDPLGDILADALADFAPFDSGDVLVIAQKVVSKVEGRLRQLDEIAPQAQATELAEHLKKDARLVQAVLDESRRVVRAENGVLIVEHRLGLIMANAGIDQSNVMQSDGGTILLLPDDPDGSAAALRLEIARHLATAPAIVIADSIGRPWREGAVGTAIGVSGLPALLDLRGNDDLYGRKLRVTTVAHADQLAAAASILMGQGKEGIPAVLMRGAYARGPAGAMSDLIRPSGNDLFR